MINIKTCVKGQVFLSHYFDGDLWYKTCEGDMFPVPVSEAGNATFNNVDKGILFMRYMKKYNEVTSDE